VDEAREEPTPMPTMKKKELTPEAIELIAGRFRALSEPMRLRILHALADGERTVGELVAELEAGQANVSKHLGLLLEAGIVRRRKDGLNALYSVSDETIFQLCELVCSSLDERLAAQRSAVIRYPTR
jgi:DNA-binding transcriptional ArsR family regulator